MARILALEWDDLEIRLAVGSRHVGGFAVDHALTVPIAAAGGAETHGAKAADADVADDQAASDATAATAADAVGQAIAEVLKARGIGRGECLVAVGRANLELKHLQLPPSPDDELPDLVRFQALRDFNKLNEDWPLDYIPLGGNEEEPRSVLAAAISPEMVEQITATCRAAGLQLKRLVLRPCAAASLLRRLQPAASQQVCLLVDLLAGETDLTVQIDGVDVFLRTARITGEATTPDGWRPLMMEIRRTIAAVSNRLGGRLVEAIYLCGDGRRHAALAKQIHDDLQLPATLFDPFAGLKLSSEVSKSAPEHPGRFAPLLGMLADEEVGAAPTIDFLHPRHRPEPPSRRRQWTLTAAAAACIALGLIYFGWSQHVALDDEIARLSTEIKAIDASVNPGKDVAHLQPNDAIEKRTDEIERWASGDRVWIDELRDISEKFDDPKDSMLTSLTATVALQGSEITLEGLAKDAATINKLEQKLRDGQHHVDNRDSREDARLTQKKYPWRFTSKVIVAKPGKSPVKTLKTVPIAGTGAAPPSPSASSSAARAGSSAADPTAKPIDAPTENPSANPPVPATKSPATPPMPPAVSPKAGPVTVADDRQGG